MYKENQITVEIGQQQFSLITIENVDEVFESFYQIDKEDVRITDEQIPYWVELWPSAIGMANFMHQNFHLIQGKDVLEIGCGLALPSIAIAQFARSVTISDYQKDAVSLAEKNAQLNAINNAAFEVLDWRNTEGHKKYDVILASDIAYENRTFASLPSSLLSLLNPEGVIILSEPGRSLAKSFMEEELQRTFHLAKTKIDVPWNSAVVGINVFVLHQRTNC